MAARSNCRRLVSEERAIAALLSTGSISMAAEECGLARRTLSGWLKDEAFMSKLTQARAEALSLGVSRLGGLVAKAVGVLEAVLDDPEAPAPTRVRAADVLLSRALQAHELLDIETRLAALEAAQEAR